METGLCIGEINLAAYNAICADLRRIAAKVLQKLLFWNWSRAFYQKKVQNLIPDTTRVISDLEGLEINPAGFLEFPHSKIE